MHTSRSSGGQVPMVSKETSENLDVCNTVTLKEMLRKQIETFAIIREAWRWAILAAVFGREWLSKRTLCLNGTLEELVNVLLLSWYASSDRQWRERERKPRNYAGSWTKQLDHRGISYVRHQCHGMCHRSANIGFYSRMHHFILWPSFHDSVPT